MKRVVVTGIGAVTPIGIGVPSFWENSLAGKNGIAPITRFDTTDYKVKLAGEIKDFQSENYFERLEARKLDLFAQYALVAATEAMTDSNLENNIKPTRLGVYVGSGIGGISTLLTCHDTQRERGPSRVPPTLVTMMIANIASAHIAIKYNAQGPNLPIVTACSTSTHEIGEAFFAIREGRADAIITGGAESGINGLAVAGFTNCMALTTSTNPNAASLPFDNRRAGFVMGEGAGMLVLEEYEHAKARGAKIYCEVVGYANTCDAHHITAPHPDSEGYIRMLRTALDMANTEGEEDIYNKNIYINAHGTGTHLNDKGETQAFKAVFGERAYKIPISSTKSMTGHMFGAAGAVEAIIAIKSIEQGMIPPTINLHEPDPECDLDYVPNKARKFSPDIAISTNLGFGGHNAGLIFKKLNKS